MKYFGKKLGYTKIWRDGMRDGKEGIRRAELRHR